MSDVTEKVEAPKVGLRPVGIDPFAEGPSCRSAWLALMLRIAEPVLAHFERGEPPSGIPNVNSKRDHTKQFEALARTLNGIAPWLEASDLPAAEEGLRESTAIRARSALRIALDPASGARIAFSGADLMPPARPYHPNQAVVECGILSQALLRGPRNLWAQLDPETQRRIVDGLVSSRAHRPCHNNWVLFSAMTEAFLHDAEVPADPMRFDAALGLVESWYVGDGAYSDGPRFHWDYYGSFVIHPFLVDLLGSRFAESGGWSGMRAHVLDRARRYAVVLERMISPEGTFPAIGRSICYRFGAFHALAQCALRQDLPAELPAGQVRAALSSLLARFEAEPANFDDRGWLAVGVAGCQPELAEDYVTTGSLYFCTSVFLPLGLAPSAGFWSERPRDWTNRAIWSGGTSCRDAALDE